MGSGEQAAFSLSLPPLALGKCARQQIESLTRVQNLLQGHLRIQRSGERPNGTKGSEEEGMYPASGPGQDL